VPLSVLAVLLATAVPPAVHPGDVSLVGSTLPASCAEPGAQCAQHIIFLPGWKLSAYSNFPFAGSAQVTRALIVIHGAGRNAVSTFTGMMTAAGKAGVAQHTMVLAPDFKADGDKPASDEARWSSDGWKEGDAAEKPSGVSSFTVLDKLVTTFSDRSRFPNLTHVTVVGHSAGAQFTQRYAAFGMAPNVTPGIAVNFVVANPSSYVYFDPARPNGDGTRFSVPSTSCKYDDYKYGLGGRSGYVARLTPAQAFQQYASRRVTYLLGGADTVQNGDMDTGCAAALEGPNRLTRGAHYFTRIRQLAPNAPHERIVVPSVAHDHYELFESPLASPVLFGSDAVPSAS
jgi:pimeloyl-ACP methyl ester carboxylesterase